ncbi:MAG: HigA family addiction module antidote protein [Proteobacteria bacterium]|nr:HigA family addiction module antidote protein [Pseudomonadota bacterium]MCH8221048.1 HigA family addiction module antidote protein [Pseudomonadota bacterium]
MVRRKPVHPGEVLKSDFLDELDLTAYRLAKDLRIQKSRISAIVNAQRAISADTALRLSRYFGNSAEFWLNLQSDYDLELIRRSTSKQIEREVRPLKECA